MISINNYISEKLVINKNTKLQYKYFPETKGELQDIIEQRIEEEGNECNLNDIDVSKIIDMSELFSSLNIKNIDISRWDVSNVKTMKSMFQGCIALKSIGDISRWDVSSVQNMYAMFAWCENLTFIGNAESWNTSSVTDMQGMFYRCIKFKQIDMSDWDVKKLNNTASMFYDCEQLKSVGDLSKWKTDSLKNTSQMFAKCKRLKDIGDISSWNTNSLLYNLSMFSLCGIKNKPEWYK